MENVVGRDNNVAIRRSKVARKRVRNVTLQEAYVAGWNAGVTKQDPRSGPAEPWNISQEWIRGYIDGDRSASSW